MSEPDAVPLPRDGEVFFDVRGEARSMRLSWYADSRIAVFSIWQGNRCTGTFRLPFGELARMVHILQAGPPAYAAAEARHAMPHRERGQVRDYGTGPGYGPDPGYGAGPDYSAVHSHGPGARGRPGPGYRPAGHEAPYGLRAEQPAGAGSPDYAEPPRYRGAPAQTGAAWSPARPASSGDPDASGLRRAAPAHIAPVESGWLDAPEPGQDSPASDTNLLGFPAAPGWHRLADSG